MSEREISQTEKEWRKAMGYKEGETERPSEAEITTERKPAVPLPTEKDVKREKELREKGKRSLERFKNVHKIFSEKFGQTLKEYLEGNVPKEKIKETKEKIQELKEIKVELEEKKPEDIVESADQLQDDLDTIVRRLSALGIDVEERVSTEKK